MHPMIGQRLVVVIVVCDYYVGKHLEYGESGKGGICGLIMHVDGDGEAEAEAWVEGDWLEGLEGNLSMAASFGWLRGEWYFECFAFFS